MAVVTTGFFDGVHLGHRKVIEKLVSSARERGEEAVLVTFRPHPRTVFQQDARALRLLTSQDEKERLLRGLGVDRIELVRFTKEFGALTAEDYLSDYVRDRFKASAVVVGYDNRFGSDGVSGEALFALAGRLGLEVIPVRSESDPSGQAVSSTRIRTAISDGRVDEAALMLGRLYSLHGVVVEGNRLGRTIGFPTANMQLYEPLKLIPGRGVYETRVETLGRQFTGMTNIGVRPTLGKGNALTVETNIFDFDEEIYGRDITVSFVRKIRDEIPFPSLEALSARLALDRASIILK
ncbi:MAG: riboflavin biosynthesis protein RibF [Bacteroidales bacterium]|nr:riboflavin biosynthesis protein RibF [Bacteroidales bacterium]